MLASCYLLRKALKELVASDCVQGSECNWLMACLISAFSSLLGEVKQLHREDFMNRHHHASCSRLLKEVQTQRHVLLTVWLEVVSILEYFVEGGRAGVEIGGRTKRAYMSLRHLKCMNELQFS